MAGRLLVDTSSTTMVSRCRADGVARTAVGNQDGEVALCCERRYYVHIQSVRAEIVAAMDTPVTAERLQNYNQANTNSRANVDDRLELAPPGNPRPFVLFDGPLYKIPK
jgi:hypothetical protein